MKTKTRFLFVWLFATATLQAQILTPVKWNIRLADTESVEKEVTFTATMDKGWHLYDMHLPEGGPVSTSITYDKVQGAELEGAPAASVAPMKAHDEMFDMELRWFTDRVTFTQKLKVTDVKKFYLTGEVEFMCCNDEQCLPPDRVTFTFDKSYVRNTLASDQLSAGETVADTPPEPAGDTATATELKPMDPVSSGTNVRITGAKPAPGVLSRSPELWTPVIDELKSYGGIAADTVNDSALYLFLAGLVGGLLALATPCVWPMIPMTVSFFLKRSKKRRKAITDAIIYGLSIVIIYLAMGLLVTAAFGASALNNLSTNAIFNIFFFLLLVVFAISFFGAFDLTLPSSWTNRMDSKADSSSGIGSLFFMAFTLVLVSFSCTGPIIGTLLVEAAADGVTIGPAVGMFGFALALAIPFALFASFPNLMQRMPKSGRWLRVVKISLGFLELALALKFLSVADLAYGWRLLDREVFIALWIVIFGLLGLFLLGKLRFKSEKGGYMTVTRLFMAILSLSFALYMIPGLWGAPLKAISAFAPPLYTQDFNLYEGEVRSVYEDYDEGMAQARKAGKPALIDFSGYGCVNCRKMEAAVWTDPRAKALLEEKFILISLMVDDKSKLPAPVTVRENDKNRTLKSVGDKWSYLQRSKFGANAQPFYVILDAAGQPISPSYAFDENATNFVRFLENGLKNYSK
ncbi:MAG: thioredoxin family protein [Tannerella sp.]|jgi:thiol:disulfide interchange protein DsbD|nr:thioredoxin family protein [Tannerella sp.]